MQTRCNACGRTVRREEDWGGSAWRDGSRKLCRKCFAKEVDVQYREIVGRKPRTYPLRRILWMIRSNALRIIMSFWKKPVKEKYPGLGGNTPLISACIHRDIQRINALIAAGAKVNETLDSGFTALMATVMGSMQDDRFNIPCLKALIAAGAKVNAKDDMKRTALMTAAHWGFPESLKILIAAGAKVNAKDKNGETALMNAAPYGHVECVAILIAAGADINATDNKGNTALMLAGGGVGPVLRAAGARE